MNIKGNLLPLFINFLIKSQQAVAQCERLLDLAEELHKPIIRKFKKRTVYSRFKENIWGADLAINKEV